MTTTQSYAGTDNQTIGMMVAARPSRARIFERYGLDYCCGGKTRLDVACHAKGIDIATILREIEASDNTSADSEDSDWASAPLHDLADHIVAVHHAYLRNALPRLSGLIEKVTVAHGERNPGLSEVEATFRTFRHDLERHTEEEETLLFPLITARSAEPGRDAGASVHSLIDALERDHGHAGEELQKLRTLTNDYSAPVNACNTYLAMLDGLSELEADMHTHVHKENSILFPRALKAEAAAR